MARKKNTFDLFNSISPCCYVRRYSDLVYAPIGFTHGDTGKPGVIEAFRCLRCSSLMTAERWTTLYRLPLEKFNKIIQRLKENGK